MSSLKYCEDLLERWDKRVQIEAALLFFFSIVVGSSFISIYMFYEANNPILYFLPLLYICAMFCWWHFCKRIAFNTTEKNLGAFWSNAFGFWIWQVITAAICFGSWDEWGWNDDAGEKYPLFDNLYRFINCFLVTAYICTLSYDYFNEIKDRYTRIKLWAGFVCIHAIVSLAFFADWLSINKEEALAGQVIALIGCIGLILSSLTVFFLKQFKHYPLVALIFSLVLYWWGTSALNCDFYPDTSDMTVMPGYQMLWTMCILIVLEALPTMASSIHVLGAELLGDDDYDDDVTSNVSPVSTGVQA